MSRALSHKCLVEFVKTVVIAFKEEYLRLPSRSDVANILYLHEKKHQVKGMLGSLDCMHIHWKNCPVGWQGTHRGKEKRSKLVLEAACDYNLWFWHTFFGCPGAMNDINILHVSPLFDAFLNGSFNNLDKRFEIDNQVFQNSCYYLVDGIYPELARFVKTISSPITSAQKEFAAWQEAC